MSVSSETKKKRRKTNRVDELALPSLFETVETDDLLSGLKTAIGRSKSSYLDAYGAMVSSAKKLAHSGDADAFVAVAYMAYGWMPTILDTFGPKTTEPDGRNWQEIIEKLQNAGQTGFKARSLNDADHLIDRLDDRSLVNGSWVGFSKFLHFINPECFPIWDSRVAMHWAAEQPAHWHNSKWAYRAYLKFCFAELETEAVSAVKSVLDAPEISDMRALELALFLLKPDGTPQNS